MHGYRSAAVDFNFISLAQSCNFTDVVQFGCANRSILCVSYSPIAPQTKRMCAEMTNRSRRTKQVDKLLSQKINYNSVHPHSFWRVCDCLVYFCLYVQTKRKMWSPPSPVPLLQQQFNQSNLHLNERSNRLFLDLQALTHSNTERQVAAQPLRMNINNINNAVLSQSTHPAHSHHFGWVQKRQTNRFPVSSIITSLNENLNTKEYDNWLSHSPKKKAIFHWHCHRMIAPIAMAKDVCNSEWKSTAKKWEKIAVRLFHV